MNKIVFCLILLCSVSAFGFGRRPVSHQTYYYPQYYYQYPQLVQEKYVIPVREEKYAEVKGLQILEDKDKIKFIVVNGKIYGIENWQEKVIEDLKESKNKDSIIIEKTIKY